MRSVRARCHYNEKKMKTLNTRWKLIAFVPLVAIAILSIGNKTVTAGDWVLRKGDRIILTPVGMASLIFQLFSDTWAARGRTAIRSSAAGLSLLVLRRSPHETNQTATTALHREY